MKTACTSVSWSDWTTATRDFSPFEAFQQFKHHPSMKALLEGGEILSAGARTIVEGGWQSLPRLEMPGAMLIGDAGGTLNVPKIKGIHQALRSGMLAAEHFVAQSGRQGSMPRCAAPSRQRTAQGAQHPPGISKGLWLGMANAALETVTGGHLPWTLKNHADRALEK